MSVIRSLTVVCLFSVACGKGHDRPEELAACKLLSKSGDSLARCLIINYSWRSESAAAARAVWQWHLDSLRASHDSQAATVVTSATQRVKAGLQAQVDSLYREWEWQIERTLRLDGYEQEQIATFLARVRRHRVEPRTLEVVNQAPDLIVNLSLGPWHNQADCLRSTAEELERVVESHADLVRGQAIICTDPVLGAR